MRLQKEIWQGEHGGGGSLPSLAAPEPSSGVVDFVKYLSEKGIKPPRKVVDIGTGKGRNAIYLAREGFQVYAIDYIADAINQARQVAENAGVAEKIEFTVSDIDQKWTYQDNEFDLGVDCFSSIDIETPEGRRTYRDEMYRTLKPGGLALVTVVSVDDEWEKELISQSPGPEKNSTLWTQNGKFQKDYDEDELRDFYQRFKILELREVKKPAFKLGKDYTATNYWVVLQK